MRQVVRDELAALARIVFKLRSRRTEHLPSALFSDHPWGMMLVMFIADTDGERLTAFDAFIRADVEPAVGRRWMAVLMAEGLASSQGACTGTNIISLTPAGITAIENCMRDAAEWMTPLQSR